MRGFGSPEAFAVRARELGHPALAVTDLGTLRGFTATAKIAGDDLRPVYGAEVKFEGAGGLVCIAKTDRGLANLIALTSAGWTPEGEVGVDLDTLTARAEDLAILTGGLDGFLGFHLLHGRRAAAGEFVNAHARTLREAGAEVFVEVQPHAGKQWGRVRAEVLRLADEAGLPVVATTGACYPKQDDAPALACLEAIRDKGAYRRPRISTRHLADEAEVEAMFAEAGLDAAPWIAAAGDLADRCRVTWKPDPLRALLPDVDLAGYPSAWRRLLAEVRAGWRRRGVKGRAYVDRLKHELGVIERSGFTSYFLLTLDLVRHAQGRGILVGPGRGSAAGSLVLYLLGVTQLDPLVHRLMFERFLAPGRVDLPDVDLDFPPRRRPEVVQFLRDRYGEDRVAHISTVTRMQAKQVVKDVGRVFGLEFAALNNLTDEIQVDSGEGDRTIRILPEAFDDSKRLRAWAKRNPEAWQLSVTLETTARQAGLHPAGVVVAPGPLIDYAPIEYHEKGDERIKVTAVDMGGVSDVGLVKLDVLAVDALDVIADAVEAASPGSNPNDYMQQATDAVDAPDVIEAFDERDLAGVFQFDTPSARIAMGDAPITEFDDLVAINALNRPGPARSGMGRRWIERRKGDRPVESIAEVYDEITDDTLGIIVYQEQVIRLAVEAAGYSMQQADKLRKAVGKKIQADVIAHRETFTGGAIDRGMKQETAKRLFKWIETFGAYGFNRSHAASYSCLAAWCQWMKLRHPGPWFYAVLRGESKTEEIARFVRAARARGLVVHRAMINRSQLDFVLQDDGSILCGLTGIKQVGPAAAEPLVAKAPFADLLDARRKVGGRAFGKRVIESLLKAGALRPLVPSTRHALDTLDDLVKILSKGKADLLAEWALENAEADEFDDEDLALLAREVDPLASAEDPLGPYASTLDALTAPRTTTAAIDAIKADDRVVFCYGLVTRVKRGKVGAFGGKSLDAAAKRRKGFGKPTLTVTLTDDTGDLVVRFGHEVAGEYLDTVKTGGALAVCLTTSKRYAPRVLYAADLDEIRAAVKAGDKVGGWAGCFVSHPVRRYTKQGLASGRPCLVAHRHVTLDRYEREICFMYLQDGRGGTVRAAAWADPWEDLDEVIKPGEIIRPRLNDLDSDLATITRATRVGSIGIDEGAGKRTPEDR